MAKDNVFKITSEFMGFKPEVKVVKEYVQETGNKFFDTKTLEAVELFAIWMVCNHIPLGKTYIEEKINRVEVIDSKGRSYVNWKEKNKVFLDFQDAGKTLKVFINEQNPD